MGDLKDGDEVYVKDFKVNDVRRDVIGVYKGPASSKTNKDKLKIVILGVLCYVEPSRLLTLAQYRERNK